MEEIVFVLGAMKRAGAERVVSILANHYINVGYRVKIVLLLENVVQYELDQRIEIIDLTNNVNKNVLARLKNVYYWVKGLRSIIKKDETQKIITFMSYMTILSVIASCGKNVNIIASERNDPRKEKRNFITKKLLKWSFLNRNCRKIVFQTEYAKSCYSKKIREKGKVIYNPIEVNAQRTRSVDKIVNVGRLENQKNQLMLIDSFALIKDKYTNMQLEIYGEGRLRDVLCKRIKELNLDNRIFLKGNVPDLHLKISNAKLFVLSSLFEGTSNALMEAMMMGIPCVSTKINGINEIIDDKVNGVVLKTNDAYCLAETIEYLLNNEDKCEDISQNAKESMKKFSVQNVINEWDLIVKHWDNISD